MLTWLLPTLPKDEHIRRDVKIKAVVKAIFHVEKRSELGEVYLKVRG